MARGEWPMVERAALSGFSSSSQFADPPDRGNGRNRVGIGGIVSSSIFLVDCQSNLGMSVLED